MGEVKQMNNGAMPENEGRMVYDVMQKVITGVRNINKGSNLVDPSGKNTAMEQEPVWTLRALNLRTETREEAEGICRDLVQPGMEGEFMIIPVYAVYSKEKWAQIDEQNKAHDESTD